MSRHKLVKNLDLDDELDDYDGDYEESEELSEEDKLQMKTGSEAVRAALPDDVQDAVTEKMVTDALWHYYYDVEKCVGYLEGVVRKERENGKMKIKDAFFADMPWLDIPSTRQAVLVAPVYPRGGLLGGSSDGAPKMSKLQALAAARKKKTQEKSDTGVEKPMAGLNINEDTEKPASRGFPLRKRKDSNEHQKVPKASPLPKEPEPSTPPPEEPPQQAEPSAFANTMFSSPSQPPRQPSENVFTLPYTASSSAAASAANPFLGPSPDDIVIAAQSKAAKPSKGPPKTNGEKRADQIAQGVEAMKIDDTPRAKSKNLDVLKEYAKATTKNAANFVVIGHVDAGKSTLMGRLLYDLKVVDQRTIDRYRKEAEKMGKSSFALAWVLDQGSEERERGVTIDIATNKFETEKTAFTILDAPGHRDFIPNMIAGASQADFAVLVIDANTGSFESGLKGQTKEHALLVRSMGVQRLIVVVNKLDTVSWSQDRFTEISTQVSSFLTAAGFLSKNISFIPTSGLHGDNIARRSTEADASWYTGPTLVQELDNSEPVTRALSKPLRLTIGDIFRGGVQNPVSVSGRIEAGSLQIGDALLAQPAGQKCFVKALDIDAEPGEWAVAGQNVTLHLGPHDVEQYLKVGDVLCAPGSPIANVGSFTAKVLAFEFVTLGGVDVHRGRLYRAGRVTGILGILDKGTGEIKGKKKVRIVKPGEVARVVVEFEGGMEVPVEGGARVVLRCAGETVAAGLLE